MNKSKSALGLVGILAACLALAGCNRATYDSNGSVLTYTDAQGNIVSYSAQDLLESYQTAGGSTSTEFDKVYEVIVRKYFESDAQSANLESAKNSATTDIEKDKETATKNAGTNGTTYDVEMEKIFDTNKVDNLDELYEYHLYQEEKKIYEQNFNDSNRAAMRDGSTAGLLDSTNLLFKEDTNYGRANKGWIKEQVPYNIRHILVKVSAASGAYTQGELSEDTSSTAGEATKLATTIMRIAGANTDDGTTNATTKRETFGEIARLSSDDSSSAARFGELTEPMTKVLNSNDLVSEFKLGTYAYETLYKDKGSVTAYGKENIATITPGLTEDATLQTEVDATQKLDDTDETINEFFTKGETYDDGNTGIGQIPYGAAVALLKSAKITTDASGNNVYEGKATFYPRNILFNKYFNKHNICVITPNEIAYNDNTLSADANDGVYSAAYGALNGFSTDTTAELPSFAHNVLTNSEGQIILAVRAGTSSYQGVHFIVVQRSGLDYYGNGTETAAAATENVSNLSEYYSLLLPSESDYPTYTNASGKATSKTTYVNYNSQQSSDQQTRLSTVNNDVKNYNGSLSTYIFQDLVTSSSIKFNDVNVEKRIQSYSKTKRQSTVDDNFTTWCTNWKTYAEMIEQQNDARTSKLNFGTGTGEYQGSATAKDNMLSEVCAIGYQTHTPDVGDWAKGGKCYYVK